MLCLLDLGTLGIDIWFVASEILITTLFFDSN